MMRFKNDSGSDMPAFSIVNLTGVEVGADGVITLIADQCDSAANFLLATTGWEKVVAGKKGRCTPIGHVFVAKYDTADGTPANEENWGPDNGTLKLKKNFGGGNYAVIGSHAGDEVAVVMHTGKIVFNGKASSTISAGATSGTVQIWAGGTPGSETDTGDTVTISKNRGDEITSGKQVSVERHNSGWEVYPKECS